MPKKKWTWGNVDGAIEENDTYSDATRQIEGYLYNLLQDRGEHIVKSPNGIRHDVIVRITLRSLGQESLP